MSWNIGFVRAGSGQIGLSGALLASCLLLITACGHHQPAPVAEHSKAQVMRHLNRNGTYSVRSGDTLYAIAFNFRVDAHELAKWNGISSPYIIYPGQKLKFSAATSSKRSRGASAPAQISKTTPPGQVRSASRNKSKTAVPAKSKPIPTTNKPGTTGATGVIQSADPKSWKWPTNGPVLRGFVAGDPARNGLDIGGKDGQQVRASAGGHIVYSGNGLLGYGELIIIKHSERMLSAYAHNRVRLVKEGERVSRGQKIAEMGRNAGNEQILHFEIRVRGKPVNPLTYLPRK